MKKIILLSAVMMSSSAALAAGYQLQEYSVTGLGRAMAGAGIMGDDYSAPAFNPAGMDFVEKSGAQFGLIGVDLRSRVEGSQTTPLGKQEGKDFTHIFRLLPNVFGQYKLNDKATLGIGLYTPFGLATDYRNNWFASAQGQYSAITVVDLSPSLSYKITDKVTLGAAINLQYAVAHLTSATFDNGWTNMKEADDINAGYTIGITFQPWKTTRLGVSYRSKVDHKLHGKNSGRAGISGQTGFLDGTHKVHASITTPETIIFSAAQDIGSQWTLSGTARFTRWTRFHDLVIYQDNYPIPGQPLSAVHEHWRNTWFFAAGADYKFCKNLTFRFGTAYDQTAIKSPKYRTVRIPDERRIWTSIGASYQRDNWQVDVGYAHLFVRKARGEAQTGLVKVDSTWKTQSNILGLQFQYKF
ncbi:MAG: outer membrane protein transport protein [Alphaproteobacteria bacterium]|nr:outer membrane protein transport protein [Alphaproteobacteria bacterium]